ncbi:MAG: hypothetical protein ACLSDQ_03285 [Adlercreutzia equolifaciens]
MRRRLWPSSGPTCASWALAPGGRGSGSAISPPAWSGSSRRYAAGARAFHVPRVHPGHRGHHAGSRRGDRFFTPLIDARGAVVFAGVLAAVATAVLAFAGHLGGTIPFVGAAVATGAGTGALCLKVGRLYGTVGLSDSLTTGAVSLVLAALLYFVGLGIPESWSVVYIALLPLLSALLLCMPVDDPYGPAAQPTAVAGAGEGASGGVPGPVLGLYAPRERRSHRGAHGRSGARRVLHPAGGG